jgi:hypothetical protein
MRVGATHRIDHLERQASRAAGTTRGRVALSTRSWQPRTQALHVQALVHDPWQRLATRVLLQRQALQTSPAECLQTLLKQGAILARVTGHIELQKRQHAPQHHRDATISHSTTHTSRPTTRNALTHARTHAHLKTDPVPSPLSSQDFLEAGKDWRRLYSEAWSPISPLKTTARLADTYEASCRVLDASPLIVRSGRFLAHCQE